MRQEVAHLIHQIDAQVVVLDPDMYMHATDQQPPGHGLQIAGQGLIAVLVDKLLLLPSREGMGRGGDGRQAVVIRHLGDRGPKIGEVIARLAHGGAGMGADLDLGAQKFRRYPALQHGRALTQHGLGRLDGEIAAGLVDEEVFLFYADGQRWWVERHVTAPWSRPPPTVAPISRRRDGC